MYFHIINIQLHSINIFETAWFQMVTWASLYPEHLEDTSIELPNSQSYFKALKSKCYCMVNV